MNQLYPIIRRKRRPLLPPEEASNEGGSKKAEGANQRSEISGQKSEAGVESQSLVTSAAQPRTTRKARKGTGAAPLD